jgi:hypothetical protein
MVWPTRKVATFFFHDESTETAGVCSLTKTPQSGKKKTPAVEG